jgi:hypothetical protein
VDHLLETRLLRQERLQGDDPLRLTAIMSEAALLQQIGGPGVLQRQLLHLAKKIEESPENIEVRVLPFATTPGGVIGSSTMYLLDFASPHLPTIAWREAMTSMGIAEDTATVRVLNVSYVQALESCLTREDSLDLIRRTADSLRNAAGT